jgi:GNAT superfamily N-acetyltransferase
MATVTLRRARAGDAEEVAQIWHLGWRDAHDGHVPGELAALRTGPSFRERAAARLRDTTVATVDGEVAGFVMVVGDEVEQLYVSGSFRGKGIAGVLIHEAERQIAAGGHDAAWLAVVPGNGRARSFYEKAGWRDEGPFDYDAETERGPIAVPCHRYVKAVSP